MIITLEKNNLNNDLKALKDFAKNNNLTLSKMEDDFECDRIVYRLNGETYKVDEQSVLSLNGVINCFRITPPYYLCTKKYKKTPTIIDCNGIKIGGDDVVFIAGPCSVESQKQILDICKIIKDSGAQILRGGAYKPRTSPYYFQGLQDQGLEYLINAKKNYNVPIISEIVKISDLDKFIKDVDIIQVGARNMQNFELLKVLGKTNKPILLKRASGATIDELLMSAEYILSNGNPNVILCERGIRTFEKKTRYTLDLSSVAILKNITHLPVIVDPSHAMGNYNFVEQMSYAAVASGANGLMIEVHNNPSHAKSDGNQALKGEKLKHLVNKCIEIKNIIK